MPTKNKIAITFENNTSVAWYQDQTGVPPNTGMQQLVAVPPDVLPADDGSGALEIDFEHIDHSIAEDVFWCWNDGIWRFGLKIHFSIQVAGSGPSPLWYVMYDQHLNSTTMTWTARAASALTAPYTFPAEIGYRVVCTPQASHTSLILAVLMSNT